MLNIDGNILTLIFRLYPTPSKSGLPACTLLLWLWLWLWLGLWAVGRLIICVFPVLVLGHLVIATVTLRFPLFVPALHDSTAEKTEICVCFQIHTTSPFICTQQRNEEHQSKMTNVATTIKIVTSLACAAALVASCISYNKVRSEERNLERISSGGR